MWYSIAKGLGAVVVVLVLGLFVPVSHHKETCVVCRLFRVRSLYGVVPATRYHENDCSRWYEAHVEPRHAHIWEPSTCCYTTDLYGFPQSVGCSPGHYPIWGLSPDSQLRVYQHFEHPLDAKAIFANLTDAKTYNDRLEEDFRSKGHRVVEGLKAWELAGFPGSWNDWWPPYQAKYEAEHNEWLEWLNSNSGTSFWDWQTQRAKAPR